MGEIVNFTLQPLYPQRKNPIPTEREDVWAPESF
jgi:hypothetical protein